MSSLLKLKVKVVDIETECGGDLSASQEELLARSRYLGGGGDAGEEPEVFSEAPEQITQDQGGDAITKSTLHFTSCSSSPPPSSPEVHGVDSTVRKKEPRKPRICVRKVRGARIRTPAPSPNPSPPAPSPNPSPPAPSPNPSPPGPSSNPSPPGPRPNPSPSPDRAVRDEMDPLVKAVLMIPSAPAPTFGGDILALARQRGIF